MVENNLFPLENKRKWSLSTSVGMLTEAEVKIIITNYNQTISNKTIKINKSNYFIRFINF